MNTAKQPHKDLFHGQGWGFPPVFDRENGTVLLTAGAADIEKSLEILLSTQVGERIVFTEFGCNLHKALFEAIDLSLVTHIKSLIDYAIVMYEPRIELMQIDIDSSQHLNGRIEIRIGYRVRTTNTRHNFVFPYYLEEGSQLST